MTFRGRTHESLSESRMREIRTSGLRRRGTGNVAMGAGLRAMAKAMDYPPDPNAGAPVLDPTCVGSAALALGNPLRRVRKP